MRKFLAASLISLMLAQPAMAWGDREQGALAGIAAVLMWQKLDQAARNGNTTREVVVQQHPVYRAHPTFNGNPGQFIPQANMPIPTGFQEPCQFPGHHARIYDRYGSVIAIRVCN